MVGVIRVVGVVEVVGVVGVVVEHQQMSETTAFRTFSGHSDIRLYK